jgi:hypothetical protein
MSAYQKQTDNANVNAPKVHNRSYNARNLKMTYIVIETCIFFFTN